MAHAYQPSRQHLAPRQTAELTHLMFRDAFLALVAGLKTRPEPRWLFDDAASEKGRGYWAQLLRGHDAAIDAGQTLEHALAFARALEGYVRLKISLRDGHTSGCLRSALRDSAWVDAHGDVSRVEVLAEPSPGTLSRMIEACDREIAMLQEVRRLAERERASTVLRIA